MIPLAPNSAAMAAAKVANAFMNGPDNPQNCPFPLGFRHPARGGLSQGYRQHAQKNW